MNRLCEICGPENACTCKPCPCIWCRHRRGEELSPAERRRVEAHDQALARERLREAFNGTLGQRLRAYQAGEDP